MDVESVGDGLIRKAADGDTVAVTLLLKQTRRRLCEQIARRIPGDLRSFIEADDVVQEAHIEVFRHLRTFRTDGRSSFHRWVATITLHKLRDAIKRQRAAKRGGGCVLVPNPPRSVDDSMIALIDCVAGPHRTPSRVVSRGEAVQAVQSALGHLPEHYARAIQLVYIEGHSAKSAAQVLGRTERAVHGLCRRALKLLQAELGSASGFLSTSA